MKKNEKRMIAVLVLITVIVAVVWVVRSRTSKNQVTENGTAVATGEKAGANSEVLDDGTKLNNSNKLGEKKTFEGLELSDFQLTEKDNISTLLGTVKNTGSSASSSRVLVLTFVDKDGKELASIEALVSELQPGDSTQLNTSATMDLSDAYNFTVAAKAE